MSDLTATNCGCNEGGNSGCNIIWLLVLLSLLGGDNGCGCGNNLFGGNGDNNNCLILLLLLCCCGNNF